MSRLKELYESKAVPALVKEYGYKNIMTIPRLEKIVINVGVGEAIQNAKILDEVSAEIAAISGQRPIVRKARKAIAAFRLRAEMPIGVKVTLRRGRMWEFLDRLISIGLPRVRDFRGLSPKAFDGRGNYTLGLKDQIIFPEIDLAKVQEMRGMNVTIVTSARSDDEARTLLRELGMPFAQKEERRAAMV